jgi:uncharacterized metal-binding protein YceD (DUF177 family)
MPEEIDYYKIYVDQLRDGKVERIERDFPSEVMDVEDSDLRFEKNIRVQGEAYQSEDSLVLHLDLETEGLIPCSICNEPVAVPIEAKGVYQVISIEDIKGHIYDTRDVVRENILINTPAFAECNGGRCSERASLAKYLKSQETANQELEEGHQPFKDLQ